MFIIMHSLKLMRHKDVRITSPIACLGIRVAFKQLVSLFPILLLVQLDLCNLIRSGWQSTTVEPVNTGHFRTSHFVLCREVVLRRLKMQDRTGIQYILCWRLHCISNYKMIYVDVFFFSFSCTWTGLHCDLPACPVQW